MKLVQWSLLFPLKKAQINPKPLPLSLAAVMHTEDYKGVQKSLSTESIVHAGYPRQITCRPYRP